MQYEPIFVPWKEYSYVAMPSGRPLASAFFTTIPPVVGFTSPILQNLQSFAFEQELAFAAFTSTS
jgi:hypothetical protein